jgi:TRAP-type uncharacterized transport system fused permease subunit
MIKIKNVPIGIWIVSIIIILICLYYYYPLYRGSYEHMDTLFSISEKSLIYWLDIFFAIIGIIAVTYGFYKASNLARRCVIFLLGWSSFWALVSIFILRWQVYENYLYFIINVILLMYLNLSHVKDYFGKSYDTDFFQQKENIYCHGEYTLYSRDVELKTGTIRTYYFFSKNLPDNGVPCSKPEGYVVGINSRTGQPYLKKEKE